MENEGLEVMQEQQEEWWLTETTKGNGAPPSFYNKNSYKNVEAQLKAQRDGQSYITKLSQQLKGHLGSPNEYNISNEAMDKESLISWGKKHGITKECMEELDNTINLSSNKKKEAEVVRTKNIREEELKKIGGIDKILELKVIFNEYFGDKYNNAIDNIENADEYNLLAELIKTKPSKITVEPQHSNGDNIESLQKAIKSNRFLSDPGYANIILDKIGKFYKKS